MLDAELEGCFCILTSVSFELVGIDTYKEFVYAARDKLRKNSINAALINADARNLPFKDAVFGNVFSAGNVLGEVSIHLKDGSLIVTQIRSAIKLGGRVAVEFVHRYRNMKDLLIWLWCYLETAWEKIGGTLIKYGDHMETYRIGNRGVVLTFHTFTVREAETLFKSHGFSEGGKERIVVS